MAFFAPILSLSALAVACGYPMFGLVILREIYPARLAWWSADEPPSKDERGKE